MNPFLGRRRHALIVVGTLAGSIVLGAVSVVAQTEPTPLAEETGPLPASTYVDTSTGPSVVFSVGDGWAVSGEPLAEVGTELAPDGFVTLTTFDGNVFTAPCAANGRVDKLLKKTEAIEVNAVSFVDAMAAHESLVAQEVVATELGGLPALQLDVVSRPGRKCDPRTAFLWELPLVREFHLDDGAIARIIATDVGDEVVVVVIETPGQSGASPFAFLDRAMAVVETIEITPAAADAADTEAAASADGAEPSEVDVVLTDVGPDQINVIKVVREVTGLGLRDAKDIVDMVAPGVATAIVEGVDREEAERIKAAFEEHGATVEIE